MVHPNIVNEFGNGILNFRSLTSGQTQILPLRLENAETSPANVSFKLEDNENFFIEKSSITLKAKSITTVEIRFKLGRPNSSSELINKIFHLGELKNSLKS